MVRQMRHFSAVFLICALFLTICSRAHAQSETRVDLEGIVIDDSTSAPISGRELFYRSGNRIMAVPVTLQPGFSAGKPVALFEGQWLPTAGTSPNYSISRDGQRFLMLKPVDEDQGDTRTRKSREKVLTAGTLYVSIRLCGAAFVFAQGKTG
jgi:hypothetical protein